jgi:ubiquitin-conjugating enzyme E2 O
VYRINRRSGHLEFGMVVENSEFVSSGDEDEQLPPPPLQQEGHRRRPRTRSERDETRLRKGFVRVAWHPKGDEEVVKENRLNLADRSLMPGDVVRRFVKGSDTQRGYCRSVDVYATCQITGTRQVIYGVNSGRLLPLEDFTIDVVVCLDTWVGIIKELAADVVLRFKDGTVCALKDVDAELLEDLADSRDDDCEFKRFDFYPGQVLSGPFKYFNRGILTNCGKDVEGLKSSDRKNKVVRATVVKTEVTGVSVNWQCKAYSKSLETEAPADAEQPPYTVKGERIKKMRMLNVFAPCTLQIGDRNMFSLREDDVILMREEWKKMEKQALNVVKSTSVTATKSNGSSEPPRYESRAVIQSLIVSQFN